MKMEDRLLNPLGFQVTSYRRDALAAPDTPGASPVQESVNVPLAPEPAIGIDINAKPAAGSPTPEEDARTP
jgi:type IV secretion system protein VirB8